MNTTETVKQKARPHWHLRSGVLEASCWKALTKAEDGNERGFFTVTLQRSFKDKEGAWQHSQWLRRQDLLAAARLLEQAYDRLSAHANDEA